MALSSSVTYLLHGSAGAGVVDGEAGQVAGADVPAQSLVCRDYAVASD